MNTKEILQGIKDWTAGELDTKVDKVTGKGLSTNDYTDSEKSKLAGIASGAEVNVQSDWNATEGDAFIKNKPTIPAAVTESTVSGWGFTKNTGTVTGVKINGTTKEPSSGVVDLGTVITAHQDISGKVDKTTTVNGHALSGNVSVTKSDVGLGNVGNFKAVSTVASQGLSDTEKSNARSNIGAGTSSFSGSYNDLTDKPTIPSVGNAEVEIQKNGTKVGSFTTNQSGSKVAVNITVPTGTAANKDVPTSGNASTSQVVMGNDSRLTDSRNANDVYSWAKASSKPTYTASEVGAIPTSAKGAASGVATLDSAGKVPSSQLPSYVDDVLEYDTKSAFPTTGEGGKIYVDKSNNTTWRWSGSSYTQIKGDLTIGTTSGTAADGKVVNDHINNTSNPHGVTKAQVGLGSVVNTGDSATPVSGGTTKFTTGGAYTELAKKVDKVSGKGLSTNDYTTDEKNKLSGIASGAQANVIETVKVNGTALTPSSKAVNVTVPTKTSELTNNSNFASDASYVHTDNNYTATEKNKLSGIASGAEVNQNAFSNVGVKVGNTTTTVAADAKTDTVTLIQGSNVTLTADTTNDTITIAAKDTTYSTATTSAAGLMSSDDKTKLNGIATGATNVTTDTVSGWGYTKNVGTVTGVKVNGTTKSPSSGIVDIGTVLTSHQSVTDSNPTLSWGAKSKVATIGSTAINVTMPSNPNTDKNVKVNTTNPSSKTIYYPVWYSAASGTGELNANDGFMYRTQEGTTTAPGFATIMLGNNKGTGSAGNKCGEITLFSAEGGCSFLYYEDNATENTNHILPATGGTILNSGTYSSYALPLSGGTITGTLTTNDYVNVKKFIYFRNYNNDEYAGYVGRGGGSVNDIMVQGINNYVSLNGLGVKLGCNLVSSNTSITYIGSDGSSYVGYAIANTGDTNIYGGRILFCTSSGSSTRMLINTSTGNIGIGNNSPSYKLHVGGAVGATAFTNTSDIRKKDIIENVNLDINDIANAPIFKFTWLDPDMPEGINVGTSAQYWQTIIPEIVSEANDDEKTLSMQYGVAGLVSSVALAKKVVEQEETIKAQETRIKTLEDAIANIQNMLNK